MRCLRRAFCGDARPDAQCVCQLCALSTGTVESDKREAAKQRRDLCSVFRVQCSLSAVHCSLFRGQ